MSLLFSVGQQSLAVLGGVAHNNEDSLQPPDYRQSYPMSSVGLDRDSDVLWTRSSFPSQLHESGVMEGAHQGWEYNFEMPTGVNVRKVISGTTKDSSGNPLGGVTVRLFNTATGLQVDSQVSDVNGAYTVTDPNAVSCFAVADIAGSPERAGTTVQGLTGV